MKFAKLASMFPEWTEEMAKPGARYTLRSWSRQHIIAAAVFAHDALGDSYDTVIRRSWLFGRWYVTMVVDGVRIQNEGWAAYQKAKGWI